MYVHEVSTLLQMQLNVENATCIFTRVPESISGHISILLLCLMQAEWPTAQRNHRMCDSHIQAQCIVEEGNVACKSSFDWWRHLNEVKITSITCLTKWARSIQTNIFFCAIPNSLRVLWNCHGFSLAYEGVENLRLWVQPSWKSEFWLRNDMCIRWMRVASRCPTSNRISSFRDLKYSSIIQSFSFYNNDMYRRVQLFEA